LLVLTGLVRTSALRMNRGVPANPFRVVRTVPGQSEMTTSSEIPEQKTWPLLLRQRQFREGGKGTLGFMEVDIIQGWNHLFINCAAQHPTQNPTASMVPHALYSRRSFSTMHIRSNRKVTSHLKPTSHILANTSQHSGPHGSQNLQQKPEPSPDS
jgi:hypothetical protein